jgi:adenine phosphoribosyltransferase
MNLKDHIRSIQDYPKKGVLYRDITTLIKNNSAFTYTIDLMVENSKNFKIDKIAAMESRGFVFASALSYILKKPFILLRKKNKLPAETHSVDFELEYGAATMEVHKDSIDENDNVLLIDDLIATGGTAEAAAKLVEISKGNVSGFIFVINLFDLGGSDNLIKKGYKVKNLIEFPGH